MSPEGKVVHVNSSTLIMGPSGSGKSALLGTLAEYVWETYKLVTLIYSTDGGGFPAKVQALAQKGIIRLWRMRTRDLPDGSLSFETCMRAAQGWWPKSIDPRTGETAPGVQMIPPITERYDMSCPNGHLVKSVPFQSLLTPTLCPTCRVMADKTSMKVQKTAHRTKGFEQVGAVAYDGISSMLSWMMSDMGQRAGRLELKGEEAAIGGKVISGDMKFGGTTRSHVGFAQSRAEELVLNSLGIPFLVVPPTFTSLTLETDDEGGLSIRGPKLAGRAKTDEAPQWFGNCLEPMVVKDERDRRVFRLYLSEFIDQAGVRHLVKNRADPGILPDFLEDPPLEKGSEAQTAFTNFNLGVFFRLLDEGLKKSMERIDEKYQDAPGLPEGLVEVGESVTGVAAGAPPAAAAPHAVPASVVAKPPAPVVGKPSTGPAAGVGAQVPAPGSPTAQGRAPQAPAPRPAAARPPAPAAPKPAATPIPVAQPAPPEAATAPAVAPAPATLTGPPVGPPGQLPVAHTPQAAPAAQWARPAAPRPPAPAPRVGSPRKP
jgi:hypothetical protein